MLIKVGEYMLSIRAVGSWFTFYVIAATAGDNHTTQPSQNVLKSLACFIGSVCVYSTYVAYHPVLAPINTVTSFSS